MHLFSFRSLPCFAPDDGAGGGGGAADTSGADAAKAAADAVATELATLRKERADRISADSAREEAEATKRGEFESIAKTAKAERDALKAERDQLQERETKRMEKVDARNAERVKTIPEGRRTLVPASLKGEDLAEYLDTNWSLITGGEMAAGTQAGGKKKAAAVTLSTNEQRDADRRGLTAEKYIEVMTKAGRKVGITPTAEA